VPTPTVLPQTPVCQSHDSADTDSPPTDVGLSVARQCRHRQSSHRCLSVSRTTVPTPTVLLETPVCQSHYSADTDSPPTDACLSVARQCRTTVPTPTVLLQTPVCQSHDSADTDSPTDVSLHVSIHLLSTHSSSALISASQPDSQASANTAKPRDKGWCTTRYACCVYFPAFAGTKLYCLVTEAVGCKQLA